MSKRKQDLMVKKERLISVNVNIKLIIKLVLISIFIVSFFFLTFFKHIEIYFSYSESKNDYLLFMVLVSILTIISTMTIGLCIGNLGNTYKIGIFILCLYFAYLGYAYVGIGIKFNTNFGLLVYDTFETNTEKGIRFFVENVYLFIIMYFITLPFESEK